MIKSLDATQILESSDRDYIFWDRNCLSATTVVLAVGTATHMGFDEDFNEVCTAGGLCRLDTVTHVHMYVSNFLGINQTLFGLMNHNQEGWEFNSVSARATNGSDEKSGHSLSFKIKYFEIVCP